MTVSTFACLEKAVECSLFSTLFDFLSNLSLPILQSDNLPIWQSDNLTISQSDNLAIWQSCNLTALSPLTDCNHLINNSPFAAHNCNRSNSFGKFWSKSAQSKSLRKSVSGNKKHSTSRFFPNNCPKERQLGNNFEAALVSLSHFWQSSKMANTQRWKELIKDWKTQLSKQTTVLKTLERRLFSGYHRAVQELSLSWGGDSAYTPVRLQFQSNFNPVQLLLIVRTPVTIICQSRNSYCQDKWYQWSQFSTFLSCVHHHCHLQSWNSY